MTGSDFDHPRILRARGTAGEPRSAPHSPHPCHPSDLWLKGSSPAESRGPSRPKALLHFPGLATPATSTAIRSCALSPSPLDPWSVRPLVPSPLSPLVPWSFSPLVLRSSAAFCLARATPHRPSTRHGDALHHSRQRKLGQRRAARDRGCARARRRRVFRPPARPAAR